MTVLGPFDVGFVWGSWARSSVGFTCKIYAEGSETACISYGQNSLCEAKQPLNKDPRIRSLTMDHVEVCGTSYQGMWAIRVCTGLEEESFGVCLMLPGRYEHGENFLNHLI